MNSDQRIFTARAVIVGALLSCLLVVMDHWSISIVRGSHLAIDHMPAGGIFLFLVMTLLVNPLLGGRARRPAAFRPAELLVIYTMLLMTASVSTMGLGAQLLPTLAAPTYYATSENRWAELLLPYLRPALAPVDLEVTRPFFEGLPAGAAIPWRAWVAPLASWGLFLAVLYYVTICAMSIIRREWVERQRLAFPLIQLPVAMITPGPGRLPALFRNRLFWLGFAVPCLVSTLIGLNHYIPGLGAPRLVQSFPAFRGTTSFVFRLSFPALGFSYLISTGTALSLWFFSLLYRCLEGWFNITGVSSSEYMGPYAAGGPIFAALGTGAFAAYFFYNIYLARAHLSSVFRKATGRAPEVDDSEESMSYRHAFWGLVIGLAFLAGWLTWAGMSPRTALLFLGAAFLFWFTLTRIITESGLSTTRTPSFAGAQVVSGLGSQSLGTSELLALGLTFPFHADLRTFPASAAAHVEKIFENRPRRASTRPLPWVMLGALLIAFVVSTAMVLHLAYRHGGINLSTWYYINGPRLPYNFAATFLSHPTTASMAAWLHRSLGAGLMFLFSFLQNRFLWWPLHPIGFSVGMVTYVNSLWFSIFLAWLVKTVLLRYGGPRVYEGGKPVFFGLILGQYTAAVIWFLIDMLTGHSGNVIFWI